jgi:hypothetical protein
MSYKAALAGAIFGAVTIASLSAASADIITVDPAAITGGLGQVISSNGSDSTVVSVVPFNPPGAPPPVFDVVVQSPVFGQSWNALGLSKYNANGSIGDAFTFSSGITGIFVRHVHQIDPVSFTISNIPFNFLSIGLASATNDRTGGDVVFLFNHTNGALDATSVSIEPGNPGLQTFAFDEQGLSSVEFFPVTTEGNLLQFNNLGITTSAVPGPMLGAGLPGLIFAGGGLLAWWRRKRRAQVVG